MWQLLIDYLYPIITNFLLWFSVRLPITNAWHLAIIMCSSFKQCLRLGYLYNFLHFIFANYSHIVRLRPVIFSFVTHPYALPLVLSIGLKNHVNTLYNWIRLKGEGFGKKYTLVNDILEMLENNFNTYTIHKLFLQVCKFYIFCENFIPRSCCFVIIREIMKLRAQTARELNYISRLKVLAWKIFFV